MLHPVPELSVDQASTGPASKPRQNTRRQNLRALTLAVMTGLTSLTMTEVVLLASTFATAGTGPGGNVIADVEPTGLPDSAAYVIKAAWGRVPRDVRTVPLSLRLAPPMSIEVGNTNLAGSGDAAAFSGHGIRSRADPTPLRRLTHWDPGNAAGCVRVRTQSPRA